MKIDVHRFLIDLVQLFAENSGRRLLEKFTGEEREKSTSAGVGMRYVEASRSSGTKPMSLFQQPARLELHADAIASRQGVNLTGHGNIRDSLTGVVFE